MRILLICVVVTLSIKNAQVAKLVDAADLKSADYCNHAGSSPALGTIQKTSLLIKITRFFIASLKWNLTKII